MDRLIEGVGMRVVGSTTECDEAVEMVKEHHPDVLIAGIDPADSAQLSCLRRALQTQPDLKEVVVGESADPVLIDAAFAAGAVVYCVKTAEQEDLASAICQAFQQSIYLATNGNHGVPPFVEDELPGHDLTRRELEILRLVADGHSNAQLAHMLWVTEQTIKFHLSNIYRKLEVANRTEASRWAQLHGLLSPRRETETPPAVSAAS